MRDDPEDAMGVDYSPPSERWELLLDPGVCLVSTHPGKKALYRDSPAPYFAVHVEPSLMLR
jgi:hypothetical protein